MKFTRVSIAFQDQARRMCAASGKKASAPVGSIRGWSVWTMDGKAWLFNGKRGLRADWFDFCEFVRLNRETRAEMVKRIHRDVFPHTDYGYTWVECYWYERDGHRVSATSPCGGCCERTGHLPGGPLGNAEMMALDDLRFCGRSCPSPVRTETVHERPHRVNSVSIMPC